MITHILAVSPFVMDDPKTAALKPLEEAAEVFGAWQAMSDTDDPELLGFMAEEHRGGRA